MADVFTKKKRSEVMAAIKEKNTKPEIIVRKVLFSHGFRYLINNKKLPGSPDIVLPKHKIAIFVNGCFWHGHKGCKYFRVPKTRTKFWKEKIGANRARDRRVAAQLKKQGWSVLTIWECKTKKSKEILDHYLIKTILLRMKKKMTSHAGKKC